MAHVPQINAAVPGFYNFSSDLDITFALNSKTRVFTGVVKHIKTISLYILVITLFVSLQGRAVTRYIEYFVTGQVTYTPPVKSASKLNSVKAHCKLQCFTQKFRQISIESSHSSTLAIIAISLKNDRNAASAERQQQPGILHKIPLRGPPIC